MVGSAILSALAGGSLIGLAAVVLMLSSGRVLGVSGIVGGLARAPAGDIAWRIAFLAGLIAGPILVPVFGGSQPAVHLAAPPALVIVAGALVGFGSRLGSGCTSGHGVCGLARGSRRSFVATATFMAVAAAIVFLTQHVFSGGVSG
ncbi:MAG: YeeE/YedE family protein [Rhodospirillales bacterium]|nr:YeeE/YedE family protein [Rhodospirillales bacterium]